MGGCCPADAMLGIEQQTVTDLARQMCGTLASCASFARAAENLSLCCGIAVSKETLRQITLCAGRLAAAQPHPALPAGPAGEATYVGVDGVLAPMVTEDEKQTRHERRVERRKLRARVQARVQAQTGEQAARQRPLPEPRPGYPEKWHEMKLAKVYRSDGTARVVATCGGPDELGHRLATMAAAIGLDQCTPQVAIIDGAPWIARQLDTHLPRLEGRLLDFYHFAEHVSAAGKAALGETLGASWASGVRYAAVNDGPGEVMQRIITLRREVARKPAARAAVDALLNYLRPRLAMINYPAARARGWDIGSGPTESTCKQLSARLKLPGARWDMHNAEAMMNLIARQAA